MLASMKSLGISISLLSEDSIHPSHSLLVENVKIRALCNTLECYKPNLNRAAPIIFWAAWIILSSLSALNSKSFVHKQFQPHLFTSYPSLPVSNGPQTCESHLMLDLLFASDIPLLLRTPMKSRSSTCGRQVVKSVPRLHLPQKLVLWA
jgi:hypothetical protein